MTAGVVFLSVAVYLSAIISVVYTLNERGFSKGLVYHSLRRWGKFLLLLVVLGIGTQLLTII